MPAPSSNLPGRLRPGRPPSLFGLAPNGVCRACRVTTASGGLLHHRFTLTRPRPGGLLSVALSGGRPPWMLSSVLPCGARTFLPGVSPAATARPTPAIWRHMGDKERHTRPGRMLFSAVRPFFMRRNVLEHFSFENIHFQSCHSAEKCDFRQNLRRVAARCTRVQR